ncbi:hypothetical protein GY45DRAFT_1264276 [Cubamyces sp. BRFM 1775]|nr:hypothetical protein GY45DRAFT_1264276 [Cubamyces sp. BRFM 1775]
MDTEDPFPDTAFQGTVCAKRHVCSLSSADKDGTDLLPGSSNVIIGRARRHHWTYKPIKDTSLSNPKRFPRLTDPLPLPAFYQETWIKHSDHFDDYHTGPTREEMLVDNKHLGDIHAMYTMDPIATYIASSSWTRFADQGMRLLAGYAHMHYLREPWEVHAHILPCPRPAPHPSQYYHRLYKKRALDDFLRQTRSTAADFAGNPVLEFVDHVPSDIAFKGLKDMLQGYDGSNPGSTENLNLFVRGFTSDGKFVCLDLERDAVELPLNNILIDIDIDSIIWVTQTLHFKLGIDLAITPTVGKAPPLRKNNHIYVNILYPPTDQERFSGEREWVENITPLSIVPHTIFAKISDSSSPIYILICFPRMLHRHEARGTWEALIPFEVQRMFWNAVLLPALRQHAEPGTEAYMPATVDENLMRAGSKDQRKGAHNKAKTVNVQPHVLSKLQATMRDIIHDNPDLSLYGSFYFVLDAKNLKLQTRMSLHDIHEHSSPWSQLKLCHPSLDFDYMVNRQNGELHIDIAYSFTPNPDTTSTHLVGLWRLDILEDSFGAGGYTKGTLHNIATLSRYGALQAPMSRERSQLSHVVFRSAYNLQYEPIRSSDNLPYFAKDGDAYETNETYHAECNRRLSLFRGNAQNTTYGVRDEYRIGGQALLSFLQGWQDKTRQFLACNPILWIKSEHWFEYLAARVEVLQYLQIRLSMLQPPNYAILTSLICHLIREVSSTHTIPPQHVRASLAHLQAQTIINNYGTLFLHDLNLSAIPMLPAIQDHDDETVFRTLEISIAARTDIRKRRVQPVPNVASAGYPLGPSPAWADIANAISSHPEGFVQPYQFDLYIPHTTTAARLFILFTFHAWSMISNAWLINSSITCPSSLEDAMEYWTIGAARGSLARTAFEATNGGLTGPVHGHREPSFRDRAQIFFPPLGHTVPSGSQWWFLINASMGYIHEYHRILQTSSNAAAQDINDALHHIFSHLQLLPYAQAGSPTSHGFMWKQDKDCVRLVINPRYYRMISIGASRCKRTSTRRVTLSKAGFLKRISSNDGHDVGNMQVISKFQQTLRQKAAKSANKKRSLGARNARNPPRPVTKSGTAAHANRAIQQNTPYEDHQSSVEFTNGNDEMDIGDEDLEQREAGWAMSSDCMDEDMYSG